MKNTNDNTELLIALNENPFSGNTEDLHHRFGIVTFVTHARVLYEHHHYGSWSDENGDPMEPGIYSDDAPGCYTVILKLDKSLIREMCEEKVEELNEKFGTNFQTTFATTNHLEVLEKMGIHHPLHNLDMEQVKKDVLKKLDDEAKEN